MSPSGDAIGHILSGQGGAETLIATTEPSHKAPTEDAVTAPLATAAASRPVRTVPADLSSVPVAALHGLAMHVMHSEASADSVVVPAAALKGVAMHATPLKAEVGGAAPGLSSTAAAVDGAFLPSSFKQALAGHPPGEGLPVLGPTGALLGVAMNGTVLKAVQGVGIGSTDLEGAAIGGDGLVRGADGSVFGAVVQRPTTRNTAVRCASGACRSCERAELWVPRVQLLVQRLSLFGGEE